MSNQKNEWDFQDNATKKEFEVLYETLKCAKLPLSTEHNAVYGLEDAALVLLYMCKNATTANRAVTELGITFRDDRSVSIPTAQWLLGMIGAMDPDKMGGPVVHTQVCRLFRHKIAHNSVKLRLVAEGT